jgi:hypothetical protein
MPLGFIPAAARGHCSLGLRSRRRWIRGLKLAALLFFFLGLLFYVSLPLFELIVWFWQFVILLLV